MKKMGKVSAKVMKAMEPMAMEGKEMHVASPKPSKAKTPKARAKAIEDRYGNLPIR